MQKSKLLLILIFVFFLNSEFRIPNFFFLPCAAQEGIHVDLREPVYSEGVLTTEKGGVISGPGLRVQALNLKYTKTVVDGEQTLTIEAEDQLIIEFGEYLFVGQKLFYDFHKKEGVIYNARTAVEPWFLAGEEFELRPDGSYVIYNGYVTTSEKDCPDWGIYANDVTVSNENFLAAHRVKLRFFDYSILWVPSLKANLKSVFDSPIRYRFRWGGRQGPRLGITYEVFSWERWKTFARFDYRFTRGPGIGFETRYRSLDAATEFQSINYIAKDSSIVKPNEKVRYRYEGLLRKSVDQGKLSFLLTYDKISDLDMPSNYYDWDFDIDKTQRTQLLIRQQEDYWISNCYTRLKVNNFQTVKQELPTYSIAFKPFTIPRTGIIWDNKASLAFLDFKYSNDVDHVHNYSSSRLEYTPLMYRPVQAGPITITPEVGGMAIFYGETPQKESGWLTQGLVGCEVQTQLYRYYDRFKHVIEPYTYYRYYPSPTLSPHQHFIFDISDGWTRLNQLTLGVSNSVYRKENEGEISRPFYADLYAHAFFDSGHLHPTIPKIYNTLIFSLIPTVIHTINSAWDFEYHQVDHYNIRTDFTLNQDFAIAAEFRHRSSYSWRKVDQGSFFLESFHSDNSLRHSSLSDRRDTFLLHFFYRFHPTWALEFTSRQGWNRHFEPGYDEFEIDLLTTIQTAWNLRISFQHKEADNRIALYFNMGGKK